MGSRCAIATSGYGCCGKRRRADPEGSVPGAAARIRHPAAYPADLQRRITDSTGIALSGAVPAGASPTCSPRNWRRPDMMARMGSWWRALTRRPGLEEEMASEMDSHIERYAADLESRGIERGEARRLAR